VVEKLTETLLKGLTPPAHGERFVYDAEVTGFAVKLFAPTKANPRGTRTFVLAYRRNGSLRRYRIGGWPEWSVTAARAEAKEIRQRVDRGEDPANERRERREAPTMADLVDRYELEHLARKPEQTRHDDSTMLDHIVRHVGADRRVADVHYGDIVALHRALTDSGRPVLANRVVSCASRLFSLSLKPMAGEDRPWRDQAQGNPCKGVARNPEQGRERFLSRAELARVVEGLDVYGRSPAADCIRLIMLTGCRPGEAMLATWAQFDAQPGFWIKPAATTKQRREHRLPLSAPALELINEIRTRRSNGIAPTDYVFPGQIPGQPLQQLRTCWDAVCEHAGLSSVRIYDLRHTFAAMGAGGGLGLPIIGRLLGHTQARTTQRYAHLADDPLREAADKIAGAISAASKSAKVVRLRGDR
jgi:integrase